MTSFLRTIRPVAVLVGFLPLIWGCAAAVSSASGKLSRDLSYAIENSDDPETVADGIPAYLLLLDGLIHDAPHDAGLLRSGATLYTAYAGAFVEDVERAKRLSEKGLQYAIRAACEGRAELCGLRSLQFQEFQARIFRTVTADIPYLYTLGAAWAGWIQTHQEDWNAVAEIARVEVLMNKVVELDDAYQGGGAHIYLGTLSALIPPALGGKPDISRAHFEKAIAVSGGRNLMAKVAFARYYARLIFDRELHDRLLNEVMASDPRAEGLVLVNTLALRQARELLASADSYF